MSHRRAANGTVLCEHSEADGARADVTLVIVRITWESWQTISSTAPGEMLDDPSP